MVKEIERAGIPVIHVTNLTKISEGIGSHRILRGNSVLHVFGNPSLPAEQEVKFRKGLVEEALKMLTEAPEEGQHALIHQFRQIAVISYHTICRADILSDFGLPGNWMDEDEKWKKSMRVFKNIL